MRLVALDASGQTGRTGSGRAVLCITGPDSIHRLAFVAAYFGTVLGIEIAVGIHAAHIVHCRSYCCFDARVHCRGIQSHTTESADADDTDAFGIYIGVCNQEIHCRAKIFGVDVGRCHITGFATALARIRGVERKGEESAFGHCLRIKSR